MYRYRYNFSLTLRYPKAMYFFLKQVTHIELFDVDPKRFKKRFKTTLQGLGLNDGIRLIYVNLHKNW